ncbi:MAG: phosphate ABC transporter substrate-binding protein PstS [Alcaligenaceae bacterium]|jgi:phosphate transport system substrate-binding protein|nr:phosphate ABC transporter substrate-binding protein PstS [Alcaligenaceae bacterium]
MLKLALSRVSLAVALGAATFTVQAAASVTGAGASFPYPIYAKWAADYAEATGNKINYQSIGSGGGQQRIIDKIVDFGASDDPLTGEKLAESNLLQFPAVIGGTVPVINVEGVEPGELKLTGAIVADIYLGKITKWNDKAIADLNSDVELPNSDIIVVHRSDGSGTTFGWTNYLSQVSPDWEEKVGSGKAVSWPVGQGGKGNEGVAGYVRQLANSIGYVEYAYAKQNNLSWTQLQNREGEFVQPEQSSFAAAAAYADWDSAPGMGVVLNNQPGADSWPITQATFILLHKVADKPEQTKATMDFFNWAWENGEETASELDYVPLPKEVSDAVRKAWASEIKAADGSAIWE